MPKAYRNTFTVPENGEMPPTWWKWLDTFLRGHLRLYAGRPFVLSVAPPTRSLGQNAKVHAMFAEIAEAFVDAGLITMHIVSPSGDMVPLPVTMESVKLYYKALYGPRDEAGEIRSTASYDTHEMHTFIECLRLDPAVVAAGVYVADIHV